MTRSLAMYDLAEMKKNESSCSWYPGALLGQGRTAGVCPPLNPNPSVPPDHSAKVLC
jgi:hypothetical protein